ncbi:MAG TPA: hypothetical protein VFT68_02845, partial [Lapillicoccus sp.]|nr:hypothetical protein [Lapillicoccus sp.]
MAPATKKTTATKTTAKKATAKKATPKKTAAAEPDSFTAEERDAMKQRASELRSRRATKPTAEDDAQAVLDKIAELGSPDREMAERIHAVITAAVPELAPKLWYGMPAYAKDGKNVVFFQPASKFKARYGTIGFEDKAFLDDGAIWPTAFAVTRFTEEDEAWLAALVKKAAG